jgi:hypothetical protein
MEPQIAPALGGWPRRRPTQKPQNTQGHFFSASSASSALNVGSANSTEAESARTQLGNQPSCSLHDVRLSFSR